METAMAGQVRGWLGRVSPLPRPLALRQATWLLPAAFALHVLEEAPGFTTWVNRYASDRYTVDDFVRNNGLGLVMTVGATFLVARVRSRAVFFAFYAVVLTQQ